MLHDRWALPESGIKPVCPALAGGFLTTGPPGKPLEPTLYPSANLCPSLGRHLMPCLAQSNHSGVYCLAPHSIPCPGSCKGLFHHFSSGIARPKDFLMTRCIHSCPQIIWTNGSPSMVSGSTASALPDNVLETQSPEPHPRPSQAY